MANRSKQVAGNAPGDFFVDLTCIDCDTCRQLAPSVFGETGQHAYVHAQPATDDDRRHALRALVCCPTDSNGQHPPQEVMDDFPLMIEEPVYYSGYNSPKSYGGNSYFVCHPKGNWLIDSPKYLPRLVQRCTELGGIAKIFLTHRDDVAEAALYAKHFGTHIAGGVELGDLSRRQVPTNGAEILAQLFFVPSANDNRGDRRPLEEPVKSNLGNRLARIFGNLVQRIDNRKHVFIGNGQANDTSRSMSVLT